MSAMSNYLEDAMIGVLRGTAFPTIPANFYVALYTTATDDASAGTEVSGNNYARVAVSPVAGSWAASAGGNGVTSNVGAITFPTSTGSWGTVTHFAIHDASTAGNRYFHGALTSSIAVGSTNITVSFAAGQLQITFA